MNLGMNMLALESGNDLLIIDAGVMFPGSGDNGIDVIVPDFSYLVANRSKIRDWFSHMLMRIISVP